MPVLLSWGCVGLGIFMMMYFGFFLTQIQMGFRYPIWKAGFSSMGGAIGALGAAIVMDIVFKRQYRIVDAQVRVAPLLYSIAKVGCFSVGCCRGKVYSGPFHVAYERFPGDTFIPVQLIETVVFMLIFIIGMTLLRNKNYILILTIALVSKIALDYLRLSNDGKFGFTQSVCVIVALGMIIMYFVQERKTRSKTRCEDEVTK